MGEDRSEELVPAAPASTRLKDMAKEDMPRERFLALGERALSDAELLALFFGTGTAGLNVLEMSKALLARYGGSLSQLSRVDVSELMQQKGVGEAKAIHLAAALALGKRMAAERFKTTPVENPKDLADLMGPEMRMLAQESLRVVLLNTKLRLISVQEIHLGSVNEVNANIRDILRPVIVQGAYAFSLVHNHPSGDPSPSSADRQFTRRVKEAAELMQSKLIDHVIIGNVSDGHPHGYFSFREHGLLT